MASQFIQVGVTAMRDPLTGEPLQAVPLYVEVQDGEEMPLPEVDRKAFARDLLKRLRAQQEAQKAGGAA